jgi:hypothetical protein
MHPVLLHRRALFSAALLAAPAAIEAQAPTRIDACYVPVSGTIYRRNTTASPAPGAPANCLTPAHVPFEIQNGSGGTIGPDLVYSGKIEMGKSASFGGSLLAKDVEVDPSFAPAGAGTRLMWIGQRAAFRVGAIAGTQWDWGRLGIRSTAIGLDVEATGEDSHAIGSRGQAQHNGAVVISTRAGFFDTRPVASTGPGELTLRGHTGIRLLASDDGSSNCNVSTDGSLGCTGGLRAGNSRVRGNGTVQLIPADNPATRCSVESDATMACSGGVALGNSQVRGNGTVQLIPSNDFTTRCTVESDATMACSGGVALGNSRLRGNGAVQLLPTGSLAQNCTVGSDASFSCTGGVKLSNSMSRVLGPSTLINSASTQVARGSCPVGTHLTGGGVQTAGGDMKVRESYAENDRTWLARVRNDHPFDDGTMVVHVVCVKE